MDVTEAIRFLRVTYPTGQGNIVVKSVEVASGTKRLPMADTAPINVLEDGEYYFGDETKLEANYTASAGGDTALMSKSLDNINFSAYDVLFAWVKGDNSGNKLVFSFTDADGISWESTSSLGSATGMVKFEFDQFEAVSGSGSETATEPNLTSITKFEMGVRTTSGFINSIQAGLDGDNYYTGNYGISLEYQVDSAAINTIYLDNIYVSSLTKVDDYEGYNGSNTLLNSTYSRNQGGGTFDIGLDVEHKSEASYGLKIDYVNTGGYAGATKAMDYLNLKDYDGIKLWYVSNGSGDSLTIQIQTSDGLSWESIGYMNSVGPTELYMPFESFIAPSWDTREGELNKNLNITKFSLYTGQGGDSIGGTIYIDDIKGANFKDDLLTANVIITNENAQDITTLPYTISGTAQMVNYVTLNVGGHGFNVPVTDGKWSYDITEDSGIYNTDSIDIKASIEYHNGDVIAEDTKTVSINVEGNEAPIIIDYEKVFECDFSTMSSVPTDWTIVQSGAEGKIESSLLWWGQDAYSLDVSKEILVPDGIYNLTATMKIKPGFEDARMIALTGGVEKKTSFLDTSDAWAEVKLEDIEVVNGKVNIKFTANAPGGTDGLVFAIQDVTLYKTAEINHTPTPTPVPTSAPTPTSTPTPTPVEVEEPKIIGSDETGWEAIAKVLGGLEDESKEDNQVTINMGEETILPKEIISLMKGKNTIIVLQMDAYSWTINGEDITGEELKDIDLSLAKNTDVIPSTIVNTVARDKSTVQVQLAHNGPFGFTATLSIDLEKKNSGLIANLFYYDSMNKTLILQSVDKVDIDGNVDLTFNHASDYIIVLSEKVILEDELDKITISPYKKTLYIGGTTGRTTSIIISLPDIIIKAKKKGIIVEKTSYLSSNKKIATVSKNGIITAKGKGTTTIQTTITIDGMTRIFTSKITVKNAYIKIQKQIPTMKVGGKFTFVANYYGFKKTDVSYTTTHKSRVVIAKTTGMAIAKSNGIDYVVIHCGDIRQKIKVLVKN